MKKNIIYISIYLVYLLPLALLTGSFLPDFLVCVIAVLTTFLIVNEKKYKYFNNYYFYIFIIFCIYLIVRSLFAKSIIVSLESSLFYFRFGLFAIGVWYLLDNNNKLIKNFSIFLCLTFIFALIDGYYQFFNEKSMIAGISAVRRRRRVQRCQAAFSDAEKEGRRGMVCSVGGRSCRLH